MPLALLLAMGAFSLSLSISPGPVNLTIVASGANHGFRRTLPFVTGATLGFVLLLAFVGFWFVRAIEAYPRFFDYLGMAGAAFIAHVGYRIATAESTPGPGGKRGPRVLPGRAPAMAQSQGLDRLRFRRGLVRQPEHARAATGLHGHLPGGLLPLAGRLGAAR